MTPVCCKITCRVCKHKLNEEHKVLTHESTQVENHGEKN